MLQDTRTLVLIADERHVRFLEEPRRAGPLLERPEWSAGLVAMPGHGAHAAHASEADHRQIEVIAKRVDELLVHAKFDSLIIIAPPRALGALRKALGPQSMSKLIASDPHERVAETNERLREVVRHLRLATA